MVLSDRSRGDIGWRKYLIAGWAFLECLFFGGLLYGWSSLVFVLKQEHVYGDDCPAGTSTIGNQSANASHWYPGNGNTSSSSDSRVGVVLPGPTTLGVVGNVSTSTSVTGGPLAAMEEAECSFQDSMFALCFTIGSSLFCASCALMGHINYKFGTRITRIISMVVFVIGSLMLAFVTAENPWLIFPGLSLLGIGGLPLLVTNTQVSNLFGKSSSSVVGLLCGGYDMSSAGMLVVKLASAGGFSRRNMFFLITALHSMVLVSTFGFLPKDFISRLDPDRDKAVRAGRPRLELLIQEKGTGDENDVTSKLAPPPARTDTPSLTSCMKQSLYITHVVWLVLLQIRFYYFIGTLNPYLNRIFHHDQDQVSYFTNVCFYTMMGGLVSSFCTGIVYDWQKRLFKDSASREKRELMPAVFPLGLASVLALLLSVLVMIPVPGLLYLIFIVMTLYRSFLYSMAAAFLSAIFPSQYFGVLYGVMIIAGGVFGAVQFAFFSWAEAYQQGPLHAEIFLLFLVIASFHHPLYIWWRSRRAEQSYLT